MGQGGSGDGGPLAAGSWLYRSLCGSAIRGWTRWQSRGAGTGNCTGRGLPTVCTHFSAWPRAHWLAVGFRVVHPLLWRTGSLRPAYLVAGRTRITLIGTDYQSSSFRRSISTVTVK